MGGTVQWNNKASTLIIKSGGTVRWEHNITSWNKNKMDHLVNPIMLILFPKLSNTLREKAEGS